MDLRRTITLEAGKRYVAQTDVLSRGVRSVAYDPVARTLDVEFPSRDTYRYEDVAPDEFLALMAAESIGSYVNARIKPEHPVVARLPRTSDATDAPDA